MDSVESRREAVDGPWRTYALHMVVFELRSRRASRSTYVILLPSVASLSMIVCPSRTSQKQKLSHRINIQHHDEFDI
ncbi:hypothetical protein SISNIDRAFT_297791 [Sistotremastrum niveocremeum HHB9708]|uniref:Uncharacterized protein n=2 Tax=Sistotremastraceae TaxID=3402574 RepID=A0A164NHV1_9AGAM|nr:hypothetical protein SISNIDRAFT_297791 [Sistotremastrum niveocremeum HHB9708]KZT35350.1 hypothetical protein SISSUDRAFT_173398 [Sistotremastrum suecicum HHB10207 ss-3]